MFIAFLFACLEIRAYTLSFVAERSKGDGLLCGWASCFSNPFGFSKDASGFFRLRTEVSDGEGPPRPPIQHLLPVFAYGEVPTGDTLPANAP